ncbi:hypothetical protein NBRC116592_09920 [Colwellia sp. KU-HH00111]|uniref:hypothetical protein n=1 Tax=Colwellia sp. KU-HH00111 TaxID=3127652 RepID=UPI0031078520
MITSDFIAEHKGGSILDCQYIEDEGVILVQEWVKNESDPLLFWTFFNADTLLKINAEERYMQENNKEWHEQLDKTKTMVCRVEVNKDNGSEVLIEQVFEDGERTSYIKGARYRKRRMTKLEELALGKNPINKG